MRRVRRRRKARRPSRHISISATDADWEVVRGNAGRRGLSIARYLLELVERDASEEDAGLQHKYPALALAKEEQREQLEAVRGAPGELVRVQLVRVQQEGEGEPPLPPRVMGR